MVLMNGSKNARNVGSIINIPSGGGNSKQGLASTIGVPASIISIYQKKIAYCCLSRNKNLPNKNFSWKGTVGMVGIYRR
jgi:hypothetical protein